VKAPCYPSWLSSCGRILALPGFLLSQKLRLLESYLSCEATKGKLTMGKERLRKRCLGVAFFMFLMLGVC